MKKKKCDNKIYLIVLIIHLFLSYLVFFLFNNQNIISLTREDGFFETLGAIFFLITSIVFIILFWKVKLENDFQFLKTKRNIVYLIFGIIFFGGFGEEISWGQRIFNFSTPEIIKKHNLQKEFNFHNLNIFQAGNADKQKKSNWFLLLNINVHFHIFWFIYCIIIPLLNKYNLTVSQWLKKIDFPLIPLWIGFFFISNLILSRTIGVFLSGDIHSLIIIKGDILNALMEVEEFNFAFLFLLASFYLFQKNGSKKNYRK